MELPLGFRFRPKTFELLHSLRAKLEGQPVACAGNIKETDVYSCHPQTIIDQYAYPGYRGCYVLSPTKMRNRSKRNCSNGPGTWRTTTRKKRICLCDEGGRDVFLGHKSSMAYHDGNGKKTHWLMDEYQLQDHGNRCEGKAVGEDPKVLDRWVVCYVHLSRVKGSQRDRVDPVNEGKENSLHEDGEASQHDRNTLIVGEEAPKIHSSSVPQPESEPSQDNQHTLTVAEGAPKIPSPALPQPESVPPMASQEDLDSSLAESIEWHIHRMQTQGSLTRMVIVKRWE